MVRHPLTFGLASLALALAFACGCGDDENPQNTTTGDPPRPPPTMLVANSRGDNVVVVRQDTGEIASTLVAKGAGGLSHPDALAIGPDGSLYVAGGDDAAASGIYKFDAKTGASLGKFTKGGTLQRPYGLAFDSTGATLYVASFLTDEILAYDGKTGDFKESFAKGNGMPGGLNGPNGLLFGPDGKLYVTTEGSVAVNGMPTFPMGITSQVLRYDVTTKTAEVFVAMADPAPTGAGYVSFLGLAFGPDCNAGSCDLFVSDYAGDVRQYDFATGMLKKSLSTNYGGATPATNLVGGLAFGEAGNLFVTAFKDDEAGGFPGSILRFDGETGNPEPAGSLTGGLLIKEDARIARPIGITTLPVEL